MSTALINFSSFFLIDASSDFNAIIAAPVTVTVAPAVALLYSCCYHCCTASFPNLTVVQNLRISARTGKNWQELAGTGRNWQELAGTGRFDWLGKLPAYSSK